MKRLEGFSSTLFRKALCWAIYGLVWASAGWSQEDWAGMSLEELLGTKVELASRKAERLDEVPAAVYVVTRQDIRRSGATSIPEALRLVPGMQVARLDANKWAITVRGFNGRFANKLQVLIDGRSVYTPLFSGVYWEVQDLLLEDVERIEIVRGPGATLWGANAVNGVINIVTRQVRNTQGIVVAATAGDEERGTGSVRYGGKVGEGLYYRVYGKYFARGALVDSSGESANDNWSGGRGGWRLDWERSERDALTLAGELFDHRFDQTVKVFSPQEPFAQFVDDEVGFSGGHVLGRWERRYSTASDLAVQASFDFYDREGVRIDEVRRTFDLDVQHRFALGQRQEIVWGGSWRHTADESAGTFTLSLTPDERGLQLFSAFVQDDISLADDRLHLVAGTKLERNDFTGFEIQPNVRLAWMPNQRHTFWGAVSRAARTPSRSDSDGRLVFDFISLGGLFEEVPGALITGFGNRDLKAEMLHAFEAGYRLRSGAHFYADLALFYHAYNDLVDVVVGFPYSDSEPVPHTVIPFSLDNAADGATYGFEWAADWRPLSQWRLHGGYSLIRYDDLPSSTPSADGSSVAFLRSEADLADVWELDLTLRYTGDLRGLEDDNFLFAPVDGYTELDARLGWRATPHLEFELVGQNLLHAHHAEFLSQLLETLPTEVRRSAYGKVIWRF